MLYLEKSGNPAFLFCRIGNILGLSNSSNKTYLNKTQNVSRRRDCQWTVVSISSWDSPNFEVNPVFKFRAEILQTLKLNPSLSFELQFSKLSNEPRL
jgi:hypothetical protein